MASTLLGTVPTSQSASRRSLADHTEEEYKVNVTFELDRRFGTRIVPTSKISNAIKRVFNGMMPDVLCTDGRGGNFTVPVGATLDPSKLQGELSSIYGCQPHHIIIG